MFKKRTIIESAILLLVLALSTGCDNPAGSEGTPGRQGQERINGSLSAEQMAELFTRQDKIRIVNSSASANIAGVVPEGKTLEITGSAQIEAHRALTINGKVHILSGGALYANGSSGGIINRGSSGLLVVDGIFEADPTFFDHGIPEYVRINPASTTAAVVLRGNTSAVLDKINALFEEGIPAVDSDYDNLLHPVSVAALPAWTGGKRLIASSANQVFPKAPVDTVDVSGKGKLIIRGILSLGKGGAPATLKASESGNVTLAKEGKIIFLSAASSLVGGITVKGTIDLLVAVTPSGHTPYIPASVDLAGATITSTTGNGVFVPPASPVVAVGAIDLQSNLKIAAAQGSTARLTVGTIANRGAGVTLTLPAGLTVETGLLSTGTGLTVQGPSASPAMLRPSRVSGDLTLGKGVQLDGEVGLTGTVILHDEESLGPSHTAALNQLARIRGGTVNASAITTLDLTDGVYHTDLLSSRAASLKGSVTLNGALNIGGAVSTDGAPVTLTINKDAVVGGNFNSSSSLLTINGKGTLSVGGDFEAKALTVNNGATRVSLQLRGNKTHEFKGTLNVGSNSKVAAHTASPCYVFGPGTYTPSSGDGFKLPSSGGGAILILPLSSSLTLGNRPEGNLTLLNNRTVPLSEVAYPVSGGAGVTLSGEGYGALIVSPSSTMTQPPGTTVDLGKGGVIALAGEGSAYAVAGNATVLPYSAVRGFTFHKGPQDSLTVQDPANLDQTSFRGVLFGKPYTAGVSINFGGSPLFQAKYSNNVFSYSSLMVPATGATTFSSAGPGGALITKDSDLAH
ncbi:MAG: hypothetical protein LBC60_07040 [Spirochaetaceae bacterium]|jgi:hypothetical protein|nr:hypothetical protein [Spirochaetaceae bacterium]